MMLLLCVLSAILCSVSAASAVNTSMLSGEKQIALLIYTLHQMNGSIPGDLIFLIADQWTSVPPQLPINQLVAGKDSQNAVWRRKCELIVHQKISECNENDTECITFVPSDNVYLFLLQRSNVRRMSRYLEIRRKYYYRYPLTERTTIVRRSVKVAVLADSERVYFMMTKKRGHLMFQKMNLDGSLEQPVTVEDTDYDLAYKVDVSWKVHGYSVRDISRFHLNYSRSLPANILWATLSQNMYSDCQKSQ